MKMINNVICGAVTLALGAITTCVATKILVDNAKEEEYKKGYVDASYQCGDILKAKTDEFSDQVITLKEVEKDKDMYIYKLENYISDFNDEE